MDAYTVKLRKIEMDYFTVKLNENCGWMIGIDEGRKANHINL